MPVPPGRQARPRHRFPGNPALGRGVESWTMRFRTPVPRLSAAVVLLVIGSSACRRAAEPVAESSGPVAVHVQAVRTDTLRDLTTASGTVVPSAAADWTVTSTDVAEIVELPKKLQDPVTTGDVLVRLDIAALTQELSALELAVLDASSRADRAKAELSRQTGLFERGLTSRNTHDSARLEQSAAETNLVQARTRLESVKAAESRAVIRARFNGVVTEIFRAVGDQVRPTEDPILRVVDPTRVQVAVQLPIAQLARIVPGQSASVLAIAGAAAEPATVVSKSELVSAGAPTGEVRLAFVNPATLPVNATVSAEILLDQRSSVLIVPAAAVQRDDLGTFVMLMGTDQLAHRRDVRVGLTTRDSAEIIAGLAVGERVITSNVADVPEGTAVVVSR